MAKLVNLQINQLLRARYMKGYDYIGNIEQYK